MDRHACRYMEGYPDKERNPEIMKKKLLAAAAAVLAVSVVLGGCGSNENGSGSSSAGEESVTYTTDDIVEMIGYDPSEYVVLSDYEGLDVSLVSSDYEVTDEDVEEYVEYMTYYYPYYSEIDKTEVEDGDIVNIDYVGTIDGEEFDGGTADDQYLEIGSDSFIDGFEDGLIGCSVGDTVSLDLTFPDDYSSEDLAGQDCTFEVTINYIAEEEEITYATMTDDYVEQNFYDYYGVSTVDELVEYVESYLESSMSSQESSDIQDQVLEILMDECEVTLPDGFIDSEIEEYMADIEEEAEEAEMEVADYLDSYYGYTEDEYKEYLEEALTENYTQELILQAILVEEKVSFESSDFADFVQDYLDYYSMEEDEFYETYGGEESVMVQYAENLALQIVMDSADVHLMVSDEEDEESTDEDSADEESTDEESEDEESTDDTSEEE